MDRADKIEVYYNLHKRVWSVRDARTGRVVGHVRVVSFPFGATFVVRERGRQKVLQERRKNVHAFVKGSQHHTGNDVEDWRERLTIPDAFRVTYNPYKAGHFYVAETGEPVREADAVLMLAPEGFPPQVWAIP